MNQRDFKSSTAGRSEVIPVAEVGGVVESYIWILLFGTLFFEALAVTL